MSTSTYLPRRIVPGALYEITDRTANGEHLFSAQLRPIIEGTLWRAAHMSEVQVFAFAFMSNHYHLLVSAPGPREFARFLQLLHTGVAVAVNGARDTSGKVWARRADVVPVSDEPVAQVQRLAYIVANGVKEGLVSHPAEWSGAHCAHEFQGPDEEPSCWRGGDESTTDDFCSAEEKVSHCRRMWQRGTQKWPPKLRPLPHLATLPRAVWLRAMRRLCDRVAAHPEDRGMWLEPHLIDPTLPHPPAPGRRPPCANPPAKPPTPTVPLRRTLPPARDKARDRFPVHAADHGVRAQMREQLRAFHDAYRAASASFRDGNTLAAFPAHCIKPPQAWTGDTVQTGGDRYRSRFHGDWPVAHV